MYSDCTVEADDCAYVPSYADYEGVSVMVDDTD